MCLRRLRATAPWTCGAPAAQGFPSERGPRVLADELVSPARCSHSSAVVPPRRPAKGWLVTMTIEEIDLDALSDEDLVEQMHADLYDGLKEEIDQSVRIFLKRGWSP
jgi:hypothetical protein